MSNIVEVFREKTDKLFYKNNGYSARELEQIVREYIEIIAMEYNLDVMFREVVLTGSRCRGLEHDSSDLDFVVSFSGHMREDALFDILNEGGLEIEGMKVDFNPIMERESGTLDEYLSEVEKYLEEKGFNQNKMKNNICKKGYYCYSFIREYKGD